MTLELHWLHTSDRSLRTIIMSQRGSTARPQTTGNKKLIKNQVIMMIRHGWYTYVSFDLMQLGSVLHWLMNLRTTSMLLRIMIEFSYHFSFIVFTSSMVVWTLKSITKILRSSCMYLNETSIWKWYFLCINARGLWVILCIWTTWSNLAF